MQRFQNFKNDENALLQQLETAFNDEKTRKAKEILEMKEMLATWVLQMGQMIKSGKSASAQASLKTAIDEQRFEIQNKEAENRDKLVELQRKINEVEERVKIQRLADQQAANLATEKKFKDQEEP